MSKKTGDKGEKIAVKHLQEKGYLILHQNWRHQHLELDIVAQKNNTLIIVEVKTGSTAIFGSPHEWVTRKKQKNIIKAAEAYISENNIQAETRFDIVAILLTSSGNEINHIENAFSALG